MGLAIELAAEYDHAVVGHVVDCRMTVSGGRRAACREELRPGRLAANSIRILQHPDVRVVDTAGASSEDDHSIGVGVVDGGVVCSAGWWRPDWQQQRPSGCPARPISIRERPSVIERLTAV